MSVVRFSPNSDIYVYRFDDNIWECVRCLLNHSHGIILHTSDEVIEHLKNHKDVGHKVPDYAFELERING